MVGVLIGDYDQQSWLGEGIEQEYGRTTTKCQKSYDYNKSSQRAKKYLGRQQE